jgi:hypothetical protein
MKNLLNILAAASLLMFSCEKEDLYVPESPEQDHYSYLEIPISGEFHLTPVHDGLLVNCIPDDIIDAEIVKNFEISGKCDQFTQIMPYVSSLSFSTCDYNDFQFGVTPGYLKTGGAGVITDKSGVVMKFFVETIFSTGTKEFAGVLSINSGTGKFDHSSGLVNIEGCFNDEDGSADWILNGKIKYRVEL